MINYAEMSRQYYDDAKKIKAKIEQKRELMAHTRDKDVRYRLSNEIMAYNSIYRELVECAEVLKEREK